MPSPTQAKFTQPPESPSLTVGSSVSSVVNTDLRYSYSLFGVTSKSKSEVWGWICLKIGVRAMTPHSSCKTLKIKLSDWVKSLRKDCEERLECHKWRSHSCQVTWKQVRWAEETKFTLLFRNFRTSCPTHYFSRVSFLATFIRIPYILISI